MGTIYKNGIPYSGGGGGGDYTAGNGIDITGNEISVDDTVVATKADLVDKQDTLTAGDNITIENNTISADDEVFVAVYEQTPYVDVKAAIDAHKVIVLDMPANNNQFCITFSTYTNGGNALMYAIFKMNNRVTLMTVTLTPENRWTISHTDLQDKLVSGTNIKTVNNESLLGGGNIDIQGGVDLEIGAEKWYGTYKEDGVTYQVYSKVLKIAALPAAAGITNYPHGITGIKQILCAYGFGTNGFVLNAPRQNAQDNIAIYQVQKASGGSVAIEVGKDRSNMGAYVCLVYAKDN